MRKKILYAVMMGLLLVACTTEKEPLAVKPCNAPNAQIRTYYSEYEDLYETLRSNVIPDIIDFQFFGNLQYEITQGNLTGEDITYGEIVERFNSKRY